MSNETEAVGITGAGQNVLLKCAMVRDGLSRIPEISAEVVAPTAQIDLGAAVGRPMSVGVRTAGGDRSQVRGTCVAARYLGVTKGVAHYGLEIRPWLWFLTRRSDTRIFQDQTVMDITKTILGEFGFTANLTDKTTHTFAARTYCVQYRETCFDFLSRLWEQEGIYYHFDYASETEKLVLCDGGGAHSALPGFARITYMPRDAGLEWREDQIREWHGAQAITTGEVTLDDYDFEAPKSDISALKKMPKGSSSYKTYEHYDAPGRYREGGIGTHFARVRMESMAIDHVTWTGVGNVRGMTVGGTFTLEKHPRENENQEYLVTGCTHYYLNETAYDMAYGKEVGDIGYTSLQGGLVYEGGAEADAYTCVVEAVPKAEPYRAPQITPWPRVSGVHTALVVGKAGEEIWTDKYGRIRVQFHWDRDGKKDDKSTCWVRYASPWTGTGWGMQHIPRIGQEVIVDFEEGDPDRPIATGCLWNADNMPPYALPANQTMQGIKTNKSKGGGGFNEFVMEDKAGAEYVRLQSERDYKEIIKNNAEITIGMEHKDKGNLKQTIWNDFDETIKEGNHTSTIEKGDETIDIQKGSQIVKIKTDQTETIEGKSTRTVTKDVKETYKAKYTQAVTGNWTQTVSQGNHKTELKMGNQELKVKMGSIKQTVSMGSVSRKVSLGSIKDTVSLGNITQKCSVGSIKLQAMQGITLKVGSNQIKIDMSGITIKGAMIKLQGTAMLEAKAPMIQMKADGMFKVEGPMVQIEGKALGMFKAPLAQIDGSALVMVKGGIAMIN